jgi:hypothetical protein
MPNLKIVSEFGSADVKIERIKGDARRVNGKEIEMKTDGSPKIVYKDPTATDLLEYAEFDDATGTRIQGRTAKYVDQKGTEYSKQEITPFFKVQESEELIQACKNEKTEVFEVRAYEDCQNYLDRYQMDAYYQVYPSSGTSKKDFAKAQAVEANTTELKKIWEALYGKNVVAKGTLNISSAGFLPSVGYLRAVELPGNKWTLEMAVFKENKPFSWSCDREWQPKGKVSPTGLKSCKVGVQQAVVEEL